MPTTTEPASDKILKEFDKYWDEKIGPILGWNSDEQAPDLKMSFLHARIKELYLIAARNEWVVE